MSLQTTQTSSAAIVGCAGLLAISLSSCSAETNTLLGIADDKLDSFTCEMVISELNYAVDAVNDANDYYDYVSLEVVFDMLGDGIDIYAVGEEGEPGQWLRSLADEADSVGDAFSEFGSDDFDSGSLESALNGFKSEAGKIGTYCG